jgi:hypothetical protein
MTDNSNINPLQPVQDFLIRAKNALNGVTSQNIENNDDDIVPILRELKNDLDNINNKLHSYETDIDSTIHHISSLLQHARVGGKVSKKAKKQIKKTKKRKYRSKII